MVFSSDIAFTNTVKSIQTRKGSRDVYAKMERNGSWDTEITPDIAAYIATQRSFFLATVNAEGQPYIQHRGGPPGFLKVLNKNTLAFADYKGNKQFISQGNLVDNNKAFIFLIDYTNKSRVKIWGTAEIIENDPALLKKLMSGHNKYKAQPEQVLKFTVEAFDRNCPQHIPQRFEADYVHSIIENKNARIKELEEKIKKLKLSKFT
ncbi:pyridoxamine 5'-phosphate oxidase family protein [Vibrio alginolyticus]|uniref:pyridoxamine 5'-phosphate oxidase family protein n=1 Tax=Vibrio alginolyticus TaxID=663 RepID=UPI0022DD3B50|nr:pyridoxamine 5'-phosphate oxidase family protein [Vibrio alginolyticus]MDA0407367.1 pyridoxamine 5'-phosphate oxidase family protein [Vibrio alginolyticus]